VLLVGDWEVGHRCVLFSQSNAYTLEFLTLITDFFLGQPAAINITMAGKGGVAAKPLDPSMSPVHLFDRSTPIFNESGSNETMRVPKPHIDEKGRGSPLTRDVLGEDDRETVVDTTAYPYSAIGRVETASGTCTGTMIGRRLMLTAFHCLHWDSIDDPGWMSFTPGYNNGEAPFGTAYPWWFYWADKDLATFYHDDKDVVGDVSLDEVAYDYVVVELDQDIGDLTGWMEVKMYSTDWNGGRYWDHVGYPKALGGCEIPQKFEGGMVNNVWSSDWSFETGYSMDTDVDFTGGQSGGPLYGVFEDGYHYIVGVMTTFHRPEHNKASAGPALSSLVSRAYDNVQT
jgi:V8-like Glu-specific endopeptidase